jgi:hypothetical protein
MFGEPLDGIVSFADALHTHATRLIDANHPGPSRAGGEALNAIVVGVTGVATDPGYSGTV